MKISVITPTIRPNGLPLVERALNRQTMTDFEWLIGSPFNPSLSRAKWVKDDFRGGYWTLNRIYNRLIKNCRADLIVSWQDYTFADPEALEKFLFYFKRNPKMIISGIGNKYKDDSWVVKVWQDPRESGEKASFYPCSFNEIEGNFCSCPKQALYDIGGFDEEMDFIGFGMDWYGVLDRIDSLGGYKFVIDQTNKSYSLCHGRVKGWEENNLIHGKYQDRKKQLITGKKWPVMSFFL